MSEEDERLAMPGPRGPQGNQGNRGERGSAGLSKSVRRALVFLFAVNLALAAVNLFWTGHEVHASESAIQSGQARQQAEQRQAGVILGEKLCLTFGRLAALTPPPGNPQANPSRAYLQAQHDTLAQLGADLGCKQRSNP